MERSEINKTIAKACGWDFDPEEAHNWGSRGKWCKPPSSYGISALFFTHSIPDYYGSLDACHDAEKRLTASQCYDYQNALRKSQERMMNDQTLTDHCSSFFAWSATAPQRCEAFLKTTGKWIEPITGGKP